MVGIRKRRKLYHFSDLLKDGIDFFDYNFVENSEGQKGTRYLLCNKLTDELKQKLLKYDNVVLGSCHYKYAPELNYDTIILLK